MNMNIRTILRAAASLALVAATAARAGALPPGTPVRIEGVGIESGWKTGRIAVTRDRCTLVALDRPTQGGYTAVSVPGIARIDLRHGDGWAEMPMATLRAKEPAPCLVEGSD